MGSFIFPWEARPLCLTSELCDWPQSSRTMTWWYSSSNAQVIYWKCYTTIGKFTRICTNFFFLWQLLMLIARYSLSAAISSYKTSYRKKKNPEVFSLGKGYASCGMWKCPPSGLSGHIELSRGREHFLCANHPLFCMLLLLILLLLLALSYPIAVCPQEIVISTHSLCLCPFLGGRGREEEQLFGV